MVNCSSCNKEMELFQGDKVLIFQCFSCNLALEIPSAGDRQINYENIILTSIPQLEITEVLKAELKKKVNDMSLDSNMNLEISYDSEREINIISKILKRNNIKFKTSNSPFMVLISTNELERLIFLDIFPEPLQQKIKSYFRSPEFLKRYLISFNDYFKYTTFNDIGRLEFHVPNENIFSIIQRICFVSRIYHVKVETTKLYLPWNSVLFLMLFIKFPKQLETKIFEFVVSKWQISQNFHKSSQFEFELMKPEGKPKKKKLGEIVLQEKNKTQKESRSLKITEFF